MRGLRESGAETYTFEEVMYGNSFHVLWLYDISEKWSTGLGTGADLYRDPDYSTFPLFVPIRFYPSKRLPRWFLLTDIGYSVKLITGSYTGIMWNCGLGYRKTFRKRSDINFQIGYNLQQFNTVHESYLAGQLHKRKMVQQIRSSIFLGVGHIF
ncbi:MAG: hypothetical protein LBU03_01805 [Tannerellaceae bacterium]|nr:hypothetical protein [Tannerellaceae bacterium]